MESFRFVHPEYFLYTPGDPGFAGFLLYIQDHAGTFA